MDSGSGPPDGSAPQPNERRRKSIQDVNPKSPESQKPMASPNKVNGIRDSSKKPSDAKNDKPSGAELKKQKQAEKMAKREQARKEQQRPSQDVAQAKAEDGAAGQAKKGPIPPPQQSPAPKSQHKRTNSTSNNPQKPLQLRPSQHQPPDLAPEPSIGPRKVAFMSHLYGHPRRTTLAGASKDVHPSILALGLQMSNYIICGSNARCVSTLLVFKRVINAYTTPPGTSLPRHLPHHLSIQIDYLVSCRPLSISLGNAIRWLKLEISTVGPDTPESKAKSELCSAIDKFIHERVTAAGQLIARSACSKIKDGDVILTFAKSSVVERTLAEAYRQGKKFRVIAVDAGPLFEGRNLARALADLGLEVRYALTSSLSHVIHEATTVFLGAHAMMSNGGLYSRIGTALVAIMAEDIPVIVLCESIKFSDKVPLDSLAINEIGPSLQTTSLMYDLTPAKYINMVITESASIAPSSVPVVHRLSTESWNT
ncbi:MAG: hypothetical protein Q9220_003521 [cf. Caloplaca sp. 1 TL-2023]